MSIRTDVKHQDGKSIGIYGSDMVPNIPLAIWLQLREGEHIEARISNEWFLPLELMGFLEWLLHLPDVMRVDISHGNLVFDTKKGFKWEDLAFMDELERRWEEAERSFTATKVTK